MKVKAFILIFVLLILFSCSSVFSFISLYYKFNIGVLIFAATCLMASFVFLYLDILIAGDKYRKSYYISCNHIYYLNDTNLFSNIRLLKKCKVIRHKNYLRNKLKDIFYKEYLNLDYNIKFKVYELKDDFQLIVIYNSFFRKTGIYFDYSDNLKNSELLTLKIGISEFNEHNYLEKYTSDNQKSIICIYKNNNIYLIQEYHYCIYYSESIKTVFKNMLPHWMHNRDEYFITADTLDEAKEKAIYNMNYVNNSFSYTGQKMKYFVLPKNLTGTCYHEFQTGKYKNLHFDKTSIYLPERIMDEYKFGEFLSRVVPKYNYFGPSIVTKDVWEKILTESEKEDDTIQEIIEEMRVWGNNSIDLYGCFTILGV